MQNLFYCEYTSRAGKSVDGYSMLDGVVRRDGVGGEQVNVPWGVKAYFEAYVTAIGRLRILVSNLSLILHLTPAVSG